MCNSSRNSIGTAFTLGIGTGIIIHTIFKKLPPPEFSIQWPNKSLIQKFYYLKEISAGLIANPIPDLYKATDSLTLSEEDLIHASE